MNQILKQMADIRLISCVGVEYDLGLLPHFIEYYTKLGIPAENIHIILQASDASCAELGAATQILNSFNIEPAELWIAPYTSDSMWNKRREIQQRCAKDTDWVISADTDEFHEFPVSLESFFQYCDKKGINCVQGVFIDRLSKNGTLKAVEKDRSIFEQYPLQADVICTIRKKEEGGWKYGTVNIMACRGNILPARGGHHPITSGPDIKYLYGKQLAAIRGITDPGVRFSIPLRVHHFKWKAALKESLETRLATDGVSERGKAYGDLLFDHIHEHGGINMAEMPVRIPNSVNILSWKIRIRLIKLGALLSAVKQKMVRS